MARNLVRLGHQVTILTEFPNHPSGIIPPEYKGRLYEKVELEDIEVIRVWVKASPKKTFPNRMLFYLSFMLNAFLAGMALVRNRYDAIYATSPPLFVGGAALGLSILRRVPLFFEVRDLWPESAVALGELTSLRAISLATWLEETCYRRAQKIVVVTQGIYDRLKERAIPLNKLELIPNGANVELFHYLPDLRQTIREQLGWQDRFVLMYAGIHGIAQGLEIILRAAQLLRENPLLLFVLVGDGPEKAGLLALADSLSLPNVRFLAEQPREQMPGYLSSADVALVPLRDIDLFKGALPSKLFDAWACERPVLISVDGEARNVVENAHGGIFIPPENPQALAVAALDLLKNPELRQEMGSAGRAFTEKYYSRRALAETLAEVLEADR
jgi:glycosyltransferase involved in cell wall biosynthesis